MLAGKARLSNWDIIAALCSLTLIVNIAFSFYDRTLKKNPDNLFSTFISLLLGPVKKLCHLKISDF